MFFGYSDFIDQVKKRLPPDAAIPSSSTVSLGFAPKNSFTYRSLRHTGYIDARFTVQYRTLRNYNIDSHYCNAQKKGIAHFAVDYRDRIIFLSVDDKAKIKFGEPNHLLSSGVRGKQSICQTGHFLQAEDHDTANKGSITPSVILDISIPQTMGDSLFQGQTTVYFKDAVLQPSTSMRAVVEIEHYLQFSGSLTPEKDIIILFTDGGTDHRCNLEAVKICLFLLLIRNPTIKHIIAFRPAAGQSYTNYVERIMSILNLGFQNIAFMR